MDLELHQLDRRYEALRTQSARRERRLIASLADVGQQTPIVVVRAGERWVVVDGYKRVRAVHRLGHDVVRAAEWMLGELDAVVLERVMRGSEGDSAIEQGWLLRELVQRFGLGLDELGRRFDRSTSWVSRRLGLVTELAASVQEEVRMGAIGAHAAMKYLVPLASVQEEVRMGAIGAHAAMKYLVPLARANAADCEALGRAIGKLRPTSRQVAELYAAYMSGNGAVRERVVQEPALVLKARAELGKAGDKLTAVEELLHDLRIVSSVARRAQRRLADGALDGGSAAERARAREQGHEAHFETERLVRRCDRETAEPGKQESHAGSDDTSDHLSPA